jgi:DNA polymerase III delta subunit
VVIVGEDPFLKERLITTAIETAGGEVETFALRSDEGEGDACRRLLEQWTTPTLFGGGRILLARQADAVLKGTRATALAAALSGSDPPHRLLLTVTALDGRTKLARTLRSAGGLVALPPLRDLPPPWESNRDTKQTELNQWLVAEAKGRGWSMDLAAAQALTRRVGNEPARLVQKLEQLAVLESESGKPISILRAHVERHVDHTSARLLSLYEDALRAGDVAEALTLLDRMGVEGVYDHTMRLVNGPEAADMILRGLTGNLSRLVAAHEQLDARLLAALNSPPWKRGSDESAALNAILGSGGRRVYIERDLRTTSRRAAVAAFRLALTGLRDLRDGFGLSMHAMTVRLAGTLKGAA